MLKNERKSGRKERRMKKDVNEYYEAKKKDGKERKVEEGNASNGCNICY